VYPWRDAKTTIAIGENRIVRFAEFKDIAAFRRWCPWGPWGRPGSNHMSELLITGASGFLGWHLSRYFAGRGFRVTGTYSSHQLAAALPGVELCHLDLLHPTDSPVWSRHYSHVIHAAAMTRPDECEKQPSLTTLVNVEATHLLLQGFPGSRFVHISTDLVFNGLARDYKESDPPDPPNVYARTKLWAEQQLVQAKNAIVARMALLYGPPAPFGGGFLGWVGARIEQGSSVPLFTDQYRTPVYVGDVARAIEWMLESSPRFNLYHLGGAERASRWEFGLKFAAEFGLDRTMLVPTTMESAGLVARGKDCSLDSSRLTTESGLALCKLDDGLARMKEGRY